LNKDTRLNEWFVPKFGPIKFRIFIGLLFLPYTGMCISFTIIGSLLSPIVLWERVIALSVIYALALGVSAHAADVLGSKNKPWGNYLNKRQLWLLTISGLTVAYTIGVYYIIFYVPLLCIVAILEGFFVFAYNLELFKGFFHNNFWFAVSWGVLPVLAGFIMQTSRPYKELRRNGRDKNRMKKLETRLKTVSLGTIIFSTILVVIRLVAR
jgi:small-conductance mechanosensitive channel